MTGLCRQVGDEDMFSYVPEAPSGAYLRGLYKEIMESQANLAQAASVVHTQLVTQTAFEAAQSLVTHPGSLLFRHHSEIFGCPSVDEHAALQRRLEQSEREVAELRARSAQASLPTPPVSEGPGALELLLCARSKLEAMAPAQARVIARMLVSCCWDAGFDPPTWLETISHA